MNVQNNPNFQAWFDGSKVVDAEGNPLVVYHGTATEFSVFAGGRGGFYFTDDRKAAGEFAKHADGEDGPIVIGAHLAIKNPLILNRAFYAEHVLFDGEPNWEAVDNMIYDAEQAGHDGLILRGFSDFDGMFYAPGAAVGRRLERVYDQYIAFRPEQIKSARGNCGTFDPSNPSIFA